MLSERGAWSARWRLLLADRTAGAIRNKWKKLCSPAVSEKAEVADAHEAAWQQV